MTNIHPFSQAGSTCTGQLTGGVLLAASGLFSRIRRWATPATGARSDTHGNKGPSAQPTPVAVEPLYALLLREDGQRKIIEFELPASVPLSDALETAHFELWTHPDALAFGRNLICEQISIRPEDFRHLRTAADKLVYHHNKCIQIEEAQRALADAKWGANHGQ